MGGRGGITSKQRDPRSSRSAWPSGVCDGSESRSRGRSLFCSTARPGSAKRQAVRSTGFLVGTAPTRQAFAAGRATKRVRDAVEPNHAPSMVGVHRSRATHGSSAARLPERAPGPRRRWCETRRHCALQDATTADAETDNPPTLGGPRPSWRQRGAEEATRPLDPGGHDGGDPTLWETPAEGLLDRVRAMLWRLIRSASTSAAGSKEAVGARG